MLLRMLCLALAGLLTACGTLAQAAYHTSPTPAPLDTALMARGVEVYRASYCGSCHALAAANTRGTFGPPHDAAGDNAAAYIVLDTYTGTATTPAEYIRESILEPAVFYTPGYETTNHHMPAFTNLSEDDLQALVYLLAHQHGEE